MGASDLSRHLSDWAPPPAPVCDSVEPSRGDAGLPDGATTRYVLETSDAFDALKQVTTQLGGLLVLAACGTRDVASHPMMPMAEEAYRHAAEAIASARIPAPARHYHQHLATASRSIGHALALFQRRSNRRGDEGVDPVLDLLKQAQRELQWTSAALPGHVIIDFSQGCCARHQLALP